MSVTANIRNFFARTTGFLTIPVTTLLVLVYILVALATLITDQLPPVPSTSVLASQYGGLDVSEAFKDLHIISARPHPYHSHDNDLVRNYLLQRVRDIRGQSGLGENFIIDDDVKTSGTWGSIPATGTYFESKNILVKIKGTAEHNSTSTSPPAVLFSAHFDSVSTSLGATDDGMGIVTLLQLIKYFSLRRPHRTVLFNVNDGEEDGLNGAHVFLEHPWIKNTSHPEYTNLFGSIFINLEGGGSGGRPLMFRATDLESVKSWKNVNAPHANILTAEGFNLGIIRSGTDYSVYTGPFAVPDALRSKTFAPLRGLDFTFYRGRSMYHTRFDSIPFLEGGEKSLWAMMEPTWAAGTALANDQSLSPPTKEKAVYLELFNAAFAVFHLSYLLTYNITALVVGPIILILLSISESTLARSRAEKRQHPTFSPSIAGDESESASAMLSPGGTVVDESTAEPEEVQSRSSSGRRWAIRHFSVSSFWKHGRFWIALILTIGTQAGLVAGFVYINPFTVYGNVTIPLLSSFTLAILVLSLVLSPPHLKSRVSVLSRAPATTNVPAWTSFRTLLIHSYIFSWLLVLLSTVGITQFGIGGVLYAASVSNGLIGLAAVICGIAGCFGIAETAELEVVRVAQDAPEEAQSTSHGDDETGVNERTPLVGRKRLRIVKNKSKAGVDPIENPHPYVLWILILLIVVPFPLILVSHIAIFLIPSVNQTLADGSSAVVPYAGISLLSFLSTLPAIPFIGARRVHRYLLWASGLVWVVCTGLAWIPWSGPWIGSLESFKGGLFPFSEQAPLKIFFQQTVELSPSGSGVGANARFVTSLVGPPSFLQDAILPLLPSYLYSRDSGRMMGCDAQESGLSGCSWETFNSSLAHLDAKGMIPVASSGSVARLRKKNHTTWDWTSTTNPWFEAHAKSMSFNDGLNSSSGARFVVTGNNSRACRVYFDDPVSKFRVQTIDASTEFEDGYGEDEEAGEGAGWEVQRGSKLDNYSFLRLWSRDWDRTFVVDVLWPDPTSSSVDSSSGQGQKVFSGRDTKATGRVACQWAEYESGMVGMGLSTSPLPSPLPSKEHVSGGQIPAFEEVLAYLPKWATVTEWADGLVEVDEEFEF